MAFMRKIKAKYLHLAKFINPNESFLIESPTFFIPTVGNKLKNNYKYLTYICVSSNLKKINLQVDL